MKKVINITLGGIVFAIEEDAYEKLSRYLDHIKSHFKGSEGYQEIISDIDARIAEMLQNKLKEKREVVLMKDVNEVMEVMGMPEEFGDTEEVEEEAEPQKKKRRGRVFRNSDERVLGGVCSGIGAYLNIDPILIRLAFVFAF